MEKKLPRINLDSQWTRLALYFLMLLPLILLRHITPTNEMKYLTIADQALRDGNFWCFYLDGAIYADKPPLYFWIIMLFRRIFGFHCIPVLELFSLLPAFGTILVLNKWCGSELTGRWRNASEMALMTTAYFLGGAVVLRMDMLMVLFITLSLRTFWRIYKGDDSLKLRIAFPLYVFMAIFSKGPVGIMVPLICIPVYLLVVKDFRKIGKIWGWSTWLILAALCALWWWRVYAEGGSPYLNNLLFHQTAGRAVNAFHHKRHWYYYLYTVWYAMGPWSLLTIPVAVWAVIKKITLSDLTKFFLIISAFFFVMMSAVSSKLAIYLLPCFGLFNYAAFIILARADDGTRRWPAAIRKTVFAVAGTIFIAAVVTGFFFPGIFK